MSSLTVGEGVSPDRAGLSAWAVEPLWRWVQLGRAAIATSLLVTLWTTPADDLFYLDRCLPILGGGLFCQFQQSTATYMATAVLLLVVSGALPLLSAVLHWWVTISFFYSASLFEGGDQAATIVTLLLIGVLVAHPFRNLYGTGHSSRRRRRWPLVVANISLFITTLQLAYIYLQAALSKLWVDEWVDGSALWYIMNEPTFGMGAAMPGFWIWLLTLPLAATLLTQVPIVMELTIAVLQFGTEGARRWSLVIGIALHVGIALVMGIVAFATIMIGALVISASRKGGLGFNVSLSPASPRALSHGR